jgi:hypothetical protein
MFKKKFLSILLALAAVILLPTVALAQSTDDGTAYEDTTIEWDTDWDYDWDDQDWTNSDNYKDVGAAAGLAATLFGGVMLIAVGIPALVTYIYMGITYSKIAKRLNHPNPWYAWVPILNAVQHFQLGDMSGWFVFLWLIPPAGLVVHIIALMNICEKRGLDKLLALLYLVPIANFILLGILAWKEDEGETTPPQVQETPTEKTPTAQQ